MSVLIVFVCNALQLSLFSFSIDNVIFSCLRRWLIGINVRFLGCIIAYYYEGCPMARALNLMVILVVGFLLTMHHPTLAQSLDEATALAQQAIELSRQGHYSEAVPLAQRALAIRENTLGPDHSNVAQSLDTLGGLYMKLNRYDEAVSLLERILKIKEKSLGPDHADLAPVLNLLALLYINHQGRYADAELASKRSLAIREKVLGPNHPDVAQSLNTLGTLYGTLGRYVDAEALLKRSLAIQEKAHGPIHAGVSESLNLLGSIYDMEGRYADAEPLLRRSLAMREKLFGPDGADVASSLFFLASSFQDQGRYAEAEPLFKRALTIVETIYGADEPRIQSIASSLGNLYIAQGRYADAEFWHKRSLAIAEKVAGSDGLAKSLHNLAWVYENEGRYAEAEPFFQRALGIVERVYGPDHPAVGAAANSLGSLYAAQGRYTAAEPLHKRSLTIAEKVFGPDNSHVAISLINLEQDYVYEGRYADALSIVQRTIAQNAVYKYADYKSVSLSVLFGSQSRALITPNESLEASYRIIQRSASSAAGAAVSMLAARFAARNDQLAQFVRKDQDLSFENERLDKLIVEATSNEPSKRDFTNEAQIRDRLQAIASERSQIEKTLYQVFPDYATLAKPVSLSVQETQRLLTQDEALIVFGFGRSSYAEVFTRSDARGFELKITAKDLEAQVKTLRTSLRYAPQFDVHASYALYQSVFGPFAEYIASKKRVSVVTDGALSGLPLQLLVTTDPASKKLNDVDWLVRKYAVTVLPSTASLKILRQRTVAKTAARPMIGFGDPVFDSTAQAAAKPKVASLNRSLPEFYRGVTADTKSLAGALPLLPETADELRAVAKELGARSDDIKLGEAATVTDVKHEPLDEYRVVYFATHALVAGEVEKFAKVKAEPALVLSIPDKPTEEDDGLLRASDVAKLKLNADFVVLSACNTAAGDKPGAEALSGLARAFFYAGARSLVVSNWEVDSESTVALMTGLFDALKSNPHLSHAEALRLSMLQMIDHPSKPEWVQPKFWAPFMVVGEPTKD